MISFKKQYDYFKRTKKDILKHFDKKGYSISNVSEYCSCNAIPLYIVYYILYTEREIEDAFSQCMRICKFYKVEFDINGN